MNNAIRAVTFLFVGAFCVAANGDTPGMLISGFAPEKHERFYDPEGDPPKAFIGGPQFGFLVNAWAGVGRVTASPSSSGTQKHVTMISDRYFVSVWHFQPRTGDQVTFWLTNDPNDPNNPPITYTVDDMDPATGNVVGDTLIRVTEGADLALGRLTMAVHPNIPRYPILNVAAPELAGREIYIFGRKASPDEDLMLVGRNTIEPPATNRFFQFNFDNPGVGDDEAVARGGDSGGPTFVISNGTIALIGVHANYVAPTTADTYVPFHLANIKANMEGEQPSEITEDSVLLADMDLDHDVDFDDIDAFVLGLRDPQQYQTTYGYPPNRNGDMNGDGNLNFDDIPGFVTALQIPQPPSSLLGDMDFDGDVDFDDNDDWVLGLTDPSAYLAQYGFPSTSNGDLDNDGDQDFDDTQLFVKILAPPSATEPGDMDFDGDVDFDDIDDFILALADKREYFFENQNLETVHGDLDGDGDLDFDDIAPFADKVGQ